MAKKNDKDKSKQQKPKSKTVKTIQQPKPEEKAGVPEVNLCDDCAYEFGECDGKPKFASEFDQELTGEAADHVVKCDAFLNVSEMPTVQETREKPAGPAEELDKLQDQKEKEDDIQREIEKESAAAEEEKPEAWDIALARLDEFGQSILNSRASEIREEAARRFAVDNTIATDEEMGDTLVLIVREIIEEEGGAPPEELEEPVEPKFIPAPPPARPDPKRFNKEEDFGACPGCSRPLKRTALNRYRDAIRCTNPRCRAYRAVVKTVSTGVS